MNFENIEKILNVKKIRYEYLDKLFKKYKEILEPYSTINIFIDLPSTIKQLYNPENLKTLSFVMNKKDKYIIASILLNMIGHYRHYFASRYKIYTNIIFIYNSKIDNYIKTNINENYKKTYYDKRILLTNPVYSDLNSVMKDNIKIMQIIIEFLPHCYFMDSLYCDYRSIFPFIINKDDFKDNINIILTTDKLFYQNTLSDETIILEPRSEKSCTITSNKIIKEIVGKSKTIEKNPDYLTINPENIILLESLSNHNDLDCKGIRNYGYLKSLILLNKENIDVSTIINNTESLKKIFKNILNDDEMNSLINNFKIFNNYYLSNLYDKDLTLFYPKFTKYISDTSELKKTNEVLFTKFPLTLDFIFDGE